MLVTMFNGLYTAEISRRTEINRKIILINSTDPPISEEIQKYYEDLETITVDIYNLITYAKVISKPGVFMRLYWAGDRS